MKAKTIERLSKAQERQLLMRYTTGGFSHPCRWPTVRALLDKGYLHEVNGSIAVSLLGKVYCDTFHMEISLRA